MTDRFPLAPIVLSLALLGALPARADFSADLIRKTAQPATAAPGTPFTEGAVSLEQIPRVERIAQLDLNRGFTLEEWSQISDALFGAFGQSAQLFQAVASSGISLGNVVFYVGADAGLIAGVNGGLMLVFGHDFETDRLAVHVGFMARLQAIDIGYDLHIGIGSIEGRIPGIQTGRMLAASWGMGAGFGLGESLNLSSGTKPGKVWWTEFKLGANLQVGGYVEVDF